MFKENYDKKLRFPLFLPYAAISPSAIALAITQEETIGRFPFEMASSLYEPDIPMEKRVHICEQVHNTKRRNASRLIKTGYAVDKPVSYGKRNYESVSSLRPTQSMFNYLAGIYDETEEEKRLRDIATFYPKLKRKEPMVDDNELQRIEACKVLNSLASEKDADPHKAKLFQEYLLNAIRECGITPLASEPLLAREISTTPSLRGKNLYREWRLANIETLFRENSFLTSLDRRHIAPPPAEDAADPKKQDIKWFCRHTLNEFYNNNPGFYFFHQTEPDTTQKRKESWQTTPAFYAVQDIPGFSTILDTEKSNLEFPEINSAGTNTLTRHTCAGIAVGQRETYIVHHTRPVKTPWYTTIERNTIMSTEIIFKRLSKNGPFLGSDRGIRNAIIVCSSVNHFGEIFAKKPQQNTNPWGSENLITTPYDNVNIVLLKASGVTQLRFLMLSNPIQYDEMAKRKMLTYDGFADRPKSGKRKDDIFSLSYQKTPVLLAYSMNWQNLYWAKEKYEAGEKFYVCCYPEQVKYIKKIMPEVEFL